MQDDPANRAAPAAPATPRERLFAFLADQDVDCPRCDYNLRGTRSPMCPECGVELALRVAPANPKIAAYVLAVGALAFGAGGSLVFGSIAVLQAPPDWWTGASAMFMLATLAFSGLGLAVSLVYRRAFLRRGEPIRWALAAAVGLVVALLCLGSVLTFDS